MRIDEEQGGRARAEPLNAMVALSHQGANGGGRIVRDRERRAVGRKDGRATHREVERSDRRGGWGKRCMIAAFRPLKWMP